MAKLKIFVSGKEDKLFNERVTAFELIKASEFFISSTLELS